jgi:hypothetical protein
MSENVAECAGCGRTAAQAKKLLAARDPAARGTFLCDACIAEASDAMADAPTRIPGALRPCGFCGKAEDQVAVLIAIGSKMICDECVDSYRAQI